MGKDQALEEISDCIRKGIPVSFVEAIAVIEYQERLREYRNLTRRPTLTGKAAAVLAKLKNIVRFSGK